MPPLDLVKQLKPLYSPSAKHPAIVEVPDLAFLMIDGRGDPEHVRGLHERAAGAVRGRTRSSPP